MRAVAVIFLVVLAGCPRTLSNTDRDALQDFRAVERACLARADEILHDHSIRLSDTNDLVKAIKIDLVEPWQAMRVRLDLPSRHFAKDLRTLLQRYLDERLIAWEELAKSIVVDAYGTWGPEEHDVNHHWLYRESNDAANADQKRIEATLAGLELPALPPLEPARIVELDPPPPVSTPGAAYFLVGRNVVKLDDNGFRTIVTDVDQMNVLPDGTVWACSLWHVARWDGTSTTDWKPKIPVDSCTVTPDGMLWVLNDRYYDNTSDQLGRFDGKTWKVTPAVIGEGHMQTRSLISDRDGRLYAVNQSDGGGVYILDKTWRQLALQEPAGSWLHLSHLFRGQDGHIWATYDVSRNGNHPTGFARVLPSGGDPVIYADPDIQSRQLYPFVDAAGVFTVLDPSRNRLVQANKQRQLPMPAARDHWDTDNAGPFAIDGAGRIWLDLVDGINVLDKGGKRTVYPRGSIPMITENVRTIAVTGAGPKLVAPGPVATRTITGQIRGTGKLELAMCADPAGRECPPGLPAWKTWSDAEGHFTFEKVPRWTLSIHGLTGLSGNKFWRNVNAKCCVESTTLEPASFEPDAIY